MEKKKEEVQWRRKEQISQQSENSETVLRGAASGRGRSR
jgi:hypothetical protein